MCPYSRLNYSQSRGWLYPRGTESEYCGAISLIFHQLFRVLRLHLFSLFFWIYCFTFSRSCVMENWRLEHAETLQYMSLALEIIKKHMRWIFKWTERSDSFWDRLNRNFLDWITLHSLIAFMSKSFIFSLVEYSGSRRTLKQVWAEGSLNSWNFDLNWNERMRL